MLKTTIEIADELARLAQAHAARENITLRSLTERGPHLAPREDGVRDRFVMRDASVGGRGLQPPWREGDWARIREAACGARSLLPD